ncbi:MAG TPA: DUF3365 domain-containing protein [Polyangia bacterium]|nr:DUF3365 domain-containing protein [Polyangia bacterium]
MRRVIPCPVPSPRPRALRLLLLAAGLVVPSCGERVDQAQVSATRAVDAIAQTVLAHRKSYAQAVVERLGEAHVVTADEDFQVRNTLPLPAQFLRMSAEHVARSPVGDQASFALISDWAINRSNRPRSEFERKGLRELKAHPEKPYRGIQTVGGRRYFSSLYADRAVTRACIDCHNAHADSPRHDFRLGDLMGALVVTIALED